MLSNVLEVSIIFSFCFIQGPEGLKKWNKVIELLEIVPERTHVCRFCHMFIVHCSF